MKKPTPQQKQQQVQEVGEGFTAQEAEEEVKATYTLEDVTS
jgi:hypothetical protein